MKPFILYLVSALSSDSFYSREAAQVTLSLVHQVEDVSPYLPSRSKDPDLRRRLASLRMLCRPWPPWSLREQTEELVSNRWQVAKDISSGSECVFEFRLDGRALLLYEGLPSGEHQGQRFRWDYREGNLLYIYQVEGPTEFQPWLLYRGKGKAYYYSRTNEKWLDAVKK